MIMNTFIRIPKKIYRTIRKNLLPPNMEVEESAFVFAKVSKQEEKVVFEYNDCYFVTKDDYEIQTSSHIELKDDMRPRMIKRASDTGTSLIEIHSHLYSPAEFSGSDLYGFKEFVPHVWWRLKKQPYAAIVLSVKDFDSFVWIDSPDKPESLSELQLTRFLGSQKLEPNRLSSKGVHYGKLL